MIAIVFLVLRVALAVNSPNMFVRLEEVKTPTGLNNFKIDFVAIDTLNRPMVVSCFRKNTDATVVQLGSDLSLIAGGNSGVCDQAGQILNINGTYLYYVVAKIGAEEFTSDIIAVDFNSTAPGIPGEYGKEEVSSCVNKIKFKTADDGKTVKVEIFRSPDTSFNADSGTKIAEVVVGPNTSTSYNDGKPECNKTYYYVIRAVDAAGNVSGLAGDSITNAIVSLKTTTVEGQNVDAIRSIGGAIPKEFADESIGELLTTEDLNSPVTTDSAVLGGKAGQFVNQTLRSWVFKVVIGLLTLAALMFIYAKKREGAKKDYYHKIREKRK